jgi:hypothetical protein
MRVAQTSVEKDTSILPLGVFSLRNWCISQRASWVLELLPVQELCAFLFSDLLPTSSGS